MGGPQNIFLKQKFVSANFFNSSIFTYERENCIQMPLSCGSILLWKRFQGTTSWENHVWRHKRQYYVNLWCLSSSFSRGKEAPTDKTCVVSMIMRVPTNLVSSRTLQPSTEPIIQGFSVPLDFLVERPC